MISTAVATTALVASTSLQQQRARAAAQRPHAGQRNEGHRPGIALPARRTRRRRSPVSCTAGGLVLAATGPCSGPGPVAVEDTPDCR